ncbi:MAG: type IV secretion system DotC family protein [Desulfovibrio sp.]|jgi:hypothetical protein
MKLPILKYIALLMFFCMAIQCGCAGKKADAPELLEIQEAQAVVQKDGEVLETDSAQVLIVATPEKESDKAASDKSSPELKELLELQSSSGKSETAVSKMRPSAIREAAQLATFQKAMSWRYGQLVDETERYCNIMDTAFNFSPLLLTQGQALIMPPVLAKAGASMRIEDGDTATASKATYELLEPARYIASPPTWREFLMVDSFPKAEEPNPALLPRNSEEKAIWRKAVREAWNEGAEQADQLYADNVSRMAREYRGIMLYHLLTAQHLLSKVGTASAELGRHASGNKLNIGQQVYRITRPSAFVLNPGKKTAVNRRKGNGRK